MNFRNIMQVNSDSDSWRSLVAKDSSEGEHVGSTFDAGEGSDEFVLANDEGGHDIDDIEIGVVL